VLRKLAFLYHEYEQVIDQLMPPSRRGNQNNYCRSIRGADMGRVARANNAGEIGRALGIEKFVKLNYAPWARIGTVEFRHHGGTVDAVKIIPWVNFVLRLVKLAVEDTAPLVAGTSPRPRRRHYAKVYDMLANSQGMGVTRQQVAQMLGRRTTPSLHLVLGRAGIAYTVQRIGRRDYYQLANATLSNDGPATLDKLMGKLGLPEAEKEFWVNRAAYLASRTGAAQ
jgi:hypothetical protein